MRNTLLAKSKKEALKSCRFRGHKMKRFLDYKGFSVSSCRLCGREVTVIESPLPNEIDIGGEAVAVYCDESDRR